MGGGAGAFIVPTANSLVVSLIYFDNEPRRRSFNLTKDEARVAHPTETGSKVAETMVARLMERLTACRAFKTAGQTETYRECRHASADMRSFLYDQDRRDNLINQAYRSGRNGRRSTYSSRSLRYAAWTAGRDELKQANRNAAEQAICLRNNDK